MHSDTAPKQELMPPAPEAAETPEKEYEGEAGFGEGQKVSLSGDPRLKLFAALINFLVICELFVAMYFASQDPDRLTPVFFKIFFSLLVPTIVAAFVGRRLLAKAAR